MDFQPLLIYGACFEPRPGGIQWLSEIAKRNQVAFRNRLSVNFGRIVNLNRIKGIVMKNPNSPFFLFDFCDKQPTITQ